MAWFCTQRCISPQLQQYRESELSLRLLLHSREVLFSVQADDLRVLCTGIYVYQDDGLHTAPSVAEDSPQQAAALFKQRLAELSQAEVLLNPDWHYRCVEYTVASEAALLMPAEYGLTPDAATVLHTLYPQPALPEEIAVEKFKQRRMHCHIVTGFPECYTPAVLALYPKAEHKSVYLRLTERFFTADDLPKRFPNHVLLCLRPPYFDLWLKGPEGLLLANRYPYHNFDNLLYYLLYALNKHKIDAGNTFLLACGAARNEKIGERLDAHVGSWAYPPFESHTLCLPAIYKA